MAFDSVKSGVVLLHHSHGNQRSQGEVSPVSVVFIDFPFHCPAGDLAPREEVLRTRFEKIQDDVFFLGHRERRTGYPRASWTATSECEFPWREAADVRTGPAAQL